MGFKYRQKIPSVTEIISQMPLGEEIKEIKRERDLDILDIVRKKSNKFLLIIGPCSADNEDAVCEYVSRLSRVYEKVKDIITIIPRIYTNKPRTTGAGYKGMVHQPNPMEEPDIVKGLIAIRKMHLRVLYETGLSAADEMLYPGNYPYLDDLLSYVAVGARSVENQEHRLTVSGLDIPVGMKNPTSGDLNVLLNSVQAAQLPHSFIYNGYEVETDGNPWSHCILRGAFNQYGANIPNFHYEDLILLTDMYEERKLANPTIIVDCSHANSNKKFSEQPRVAKEVLYSIKKSSRLKPIVKGLMIESYLIEGAQAAAGSTYGQSITDPCLGWEDSEKLILELADIVSKI